MHDPRPARRRRLGPYGRFVLMRLAVVPGQLLFVLVVLYVAVVEPAHLVAHQDLGALGFLTGLGHMLYDDFTGNWGVSTFPEYNGYAISTLYFYFLPNTIELAVFGLGISALVAYPVSLLLGWTRNRAADTGARVASLLGTLLPTFVVSLLLILGLFYWFLAHFHDVPDQGVIPTFIWWQYYYDGSYPSWIVLDSVTRPTGFPLVDGAIHGAWSFEWLTLLKTLFQALVIAMVYVTIFLRHARSVVRAASEELHIAASRARGVREGTLLWTHMARRLRPTFLLVFALTLPAYLGTQFVVELAFLDRGVGFLAFIALTGDGASSIVDYLGFLQVMMFLLAVIVLFWLLGLDLLARRMDPRGVTVR